MADITPPHKRTHRFGLIGAAFGLGFIIGPVIGGELGEYGPRVPFMAAAALAATNFLFGLLVLPESLPRDRRRKFDLRRANPFGAIASLRKYPVVLWLLAILFCFSLAAQALPSVFSYFTVEVFHFTSSQIGRALGAFGIGFAICQGFLVGPMVKRFGETPIVFLGLVAAIGAFAGVAFTNEVWYLYGYIMIGAISGLAAPAINGVLSRQVPDNSQGELQGAVNASNSLATIIGPLAATQIFSYYTHTPDAADYFPGAPFLAASVCCIAALILFAVAAWRFGLSSRPSIADKPIVPEMAPPGQILVPTEEANDGNNPPRH